MGRLKKRRELRIVRKEDRRMENIYQPAAAKVIKVTPGATRFAVTTISDISTF